MKRLVLLIVLLLVPQIDVHAFQYIDETYTGRQAALFADTHDGPVVGGANGYLGGRNGNNYTIYWAQQFTIEQPAIVNYISVNALLIPSDRPFDIERREYMMQRLAEGATQEQITLELDGDGSNPPSFLGSAQSIDVNFALIKGSVPYHSDPPEYKTMPSSDVLANAKYTFFTDNGRYNKQYFNLLIPFSPFSTELSPNDTYWVKASTPEFSGIDFNYSTKLVGEVNTPEPATLLLLGGGLAGAIWRRRKVTKA